MGEADDGVNIVTLAMSCLFVFELTNGVSGALKLVDGSLLAEIIDGFEGMAMMMGLWRSSYYGISGDLVQILSMPSAED